MFDDSLTASSRRVRARNPLTVLVSVGIHSLLISVLVLVPFLNTAALPLSQLRSALASPPPPPPGPVRTMLAPTPPTAPKVEIDRDRMIRPQEIPEDIADIVDLVRPPDVGVVSPGSADFSELAKGAVVGGLPGAKGEVPPPPTPPPIQPPPPLPELVRVPLRVSSGVVQGFLIERPPLEYPPLALRARIQGTVVLEAVISTEGRIRPESIRVVDPGHALLADRAVEAVRQWRYRPYVLNDEPVEVVTTIAVTYRLD